LALVRTVRIRRRQDLWAGVFFVAVGVLAVLLARAYPIGTAMRMGPGYFPTVLGALVALLGIVIAIRGACLAGDELAPWGLRPLVLVLGGVLLFAALVRPLGLVVATLALVVTTSLGNREARLAEVAGLGLFLAALALGVFVYGLGLPFGVWPW
jgi:hypothetical protein